MCPCNLAWPHRLRKAGDPISASSSLDGDARTRDFVLFYVNGKRHQIHGNAVFSSLAEFLRDTLRLVGTKIVCAEGDCGACTVLVGRLDGDSLRYETVTSCIQSLFQLDCKHVVTIEGLKTDDRLGPIQESMVDHHGSQCGFCTPGFVVSLTQMFETDASVDAATIATALTGNLCRCTGYLTIVEAGLAVDRSRYRTLAELYPSRAMTDDLKAHAPVPVLIEASEARPASEPVHRTYFSPRQLHDAVQFKARRPEAVIISGGTELGVQRNKRGGHPPNLLSLRYLSELSHINLEGNTLTIGSNVTWAQLESYSRSILPELHKLTRLFASPQIRNVATLAGNIAHGSPVADSLSFLMIAEAELELISAAGSRRVTIGSFFKGYKHVDIAPHEIITKVIIPLPSAGELWKLYKISKRKEMDITTFRAGIRVVRQGDTIERAVVSFSGVGPVVCRLPSTEAFLAGKPFAEQTFRDAGVLARKEVEPRSDRRGSRDYRLLLAENILLKFYFDCEIPEPQEASLGG